MWQFSPSANTDILAFHSTLDTNGRVRKELLDEKNLVGLNDACNTRIDVNTGKESALDLTFASNTTA